MRKEELISKVEEFKDYYKERKKIAERMQYPGVENLAKYGDWWYEQGIAGIINIFLIDLQNIIDELEAPF